MGLLRALLPQRSKQNILYIPDGRTDIVVNPLSGPAIVLYLALFKLLLHFYFNAFSYYGFLRDELYFIDCTKHLDWGYVDIGPLTIWMGWFSRFIMGDSVFALRFFPALLGAFAIIIAGAIARELGGGRFAQGLSGLTVLITPFWLGAQNNLCLPASEPLWWGLCGLIFIRMVKTDNPRLWLWFGLVAGIGLLNKPSMAFLGFFLVVSMLCTPQRKLLFNRWLVFGGLIAFGVVLPYTLWQIPRGWPTLQFLIGMNRTVMARIPAYAFILGQIFYLHPFTLPIWLAGLVFYLRARDGRPYRVIGFMYLFLLFFLLVIKSKIYYILPVYMMLIPAGAVALERFSRRAPALKYAVLILLILGGLATLPMALPILPIEKVDAYVTGATGGLLKNAYEVNATFHDEIGWENHAKVVAQVYKSLSPNQRAACVIFAANFGEAGALNFFGPAYGLPEAYSFHQNYFFWGPPPQSGNIMIVDGAREEDLRRFFQEVRPAATVTCDQAVEKSKPVYVCTKPIAAFKDIWPTFRAFAFNN